MFSLSNWFIWALLSAFFAALTAIFAKVGFKMWIRFCDLNPHRDYYRYSGGPLFILPVSGRTPC